MSSKADIDWSNLGFNFVKTDATVRYIWKNNEWQGPVVSDSHTLSISAAATCFQYGQAGFEGLKVFENPQGQAKVFRIEENARRMIRTARQLVMQPPPEEIFINAVRLAVQENGRFIPPHDSGASLYIRPFLIGSGPQIGVKPSTEYTFVVLAFPVGPYFKGGFSPVDLLVEEASDRAAPLGVGAVKAGGNYSASLLRSARAKGEGFHEILYLDPLERQFIEETNTSNFFGILDKDRYITPESPSILPSITNSSLRILAKDLGLEVEQRRVHVEEIFSFSEAATCGTAHVVTPVRRIVFRDREMIYSNDNKPGPISVALYNELRGIQYGTIPDRHGFLSDI